MRKKSSEKKAGKNDNCHYIVSLLLRVAVLLRPLASNGEHTTGDPLRIIFLPANIKLQKGAIAIVRMILHALDWALLPL